MEAIIPRKYGIMEKHKTSLWPRCCFLITGFILAKNERTKTKCFHPFKMVFTHETKVIAIWNSGFPKFTMDPLIRSRFPPECLGK